MKFARWVFLVAGLYGVAVLLPGFFQSAPSARPEFYYGFYGSALVWQFVFFAIAREPKRLRPLMLVAVAEKLAFFAACLWLFFAGRMEIGGPFIGGMIDGVWMALFLAAWHASRALPTAR